MKNRVVFHHAGCPVCVAAEHSLVRAIDPARYDVEVVHLGTAAGRIAEARAKGVTSVPPLVLDDVVCHVDFGAKLDDLG